MAVKRDVNSFLVRTVSDVFFLPILCVNVAFCVARSARLKLEFSERALKALSNNSW